MTSILRVREYGALFRSDIKTFFDILKKGFLRIREQFSAIDTVDLRLSIGLQTIPFRN